MGYRSIWGQPSHTLHPPAQPTCSTDTQRVLRAWIEARVQGIEAETWAQIGERLSRVGYWEFEDYTG